MAHKWPLAEKGVLGGSEGAPYHMKWKPEVKIKTNSAALYENPRRYEKRREKKAGKKVKDSKNQSTVLEKMFLKRDRRRGKNLAMLYSKLREKVQSYKI